MSRRTATRPHARPATWLTRDPIAAPRGWDRRDPGYDVIRPLNRGDARELVRMIPAAIVVVAALGMLCGLLIAIVPGPGQ
jgi:hypothetical protein